jgi:hypothetical protein
LRLGVALDADAIVLGEAWSGGMRYGAVREAQAAATDRGTPEIFYVRSDEADATQRGVEVAAWMDDGHAIADTFAAAEQLGLPVVRRELDAPLRDVATRTLLRTSSFVSITAGTIAERFASLDAARRATRRFDDAGVKIVDGTLDDAARAVDHALSSPGALGGVASADFAETVLRAATDESAVAENELARVVSTGGARATLVRTADGTYLVAAARASTGRELVAASVEPATGWSVEHRAWASCVSAPLAQGVCYEREP